MVYIMRKFFPIVISSVFIGFILGYFISINQDSKNVHWTSNKVVTANTPRTTYTSYRNSSNITGVQGISFMPNISGRVISRNMTKWYIDSRKCDQFNFTKKLVRAQLRGQVNTPIFVYDAKEDIHVSGSILRSGMWEAHLVSAVHQVLSKDKDIIFIDLGANVGVFSLMAAKFGRQVIAIDALQGNIGRLCRSVELGNLGQHVVLIHNAISNKREKVSLGFDKKNIGGTFIKAHDSSKNQKGDVQSILLDDLLEIFSFKKVIIKMDVEGSEAKVLEGAQKFFGSVEVLYLFMEFAFHRNKASGQYIAKFLKHYGLEPLLSPQFRNDYKHWPWDVTFKKVK